LPPVGFFTVIRCSPGNGTPHQQVY